MKVKKQKEVLIAIKFLKLELAMELNKILDGIGWCKEQWRLKTIVFLLN